MYYLSKLKKKLIVLRMLFKIRSVKLLLLNTDNFKYWFYEKETKGNDFKVNSK